MLIDNIALFAEVAPEIPKEVKKEEKVVQEPDQDGDVFFESEEYPAEELEVSGWSEVSIFRRTNLFFSPFFSRIETDKRVYRIQVKRQRIFRSRRIQTSYLRIRERFDDMS